MNLHLRRTLLLIPLLALLFLTLGAADLSAQTLDYNYLFVSTRGAGTTEDGLAYEPGDIIGAQGLGGAWFMAFDASENGLVNGQNVNAFDLTVPELNGDAAAVPGALYLTFSQPRVRVPGVPGWVTANDAVVFEEAQNGNAPEDNYELYFDGSDVGLTTRDEQIDSLSVWPQDELIPGAVALPGDCTAGVLFISTAANYRVPAAGGGSMTGRGGDVLAFCATNLGPDTAGFWFKAFDAQAAGLAPLRALRNVSVNEVGSLSPAGDWELTFSFSSHTAFNAGSFHGDPNVIYLYDTTGGVVGPVVDLNVDYPMLNGVADGLVIDRYVPQCNSVGPNC
jgi:hypothetical protein